MRNNRSRTFRGFRRIQSTPHGVTLHAPNTQLEFAALAPDLFHLTVRPAGEPPAPSWAVLPMPPLGDAPQVRHSKADVSLATSEATLTLDPRTGEWCLVDRHGLPLFHAPAGSMRHVGSSTTLALDLHPRERLFGLGETTGPLDKRGSIREFWNIDVLGHSPAIHPGLRSLYVSIPFALSFRDGRAAGLFWDCPARQTWDLGCSIPDRWTMSAESPGLDLYLFTGPTPARVVERFTELTGRTPMPPRWALGYQQCRYSYASRSELERIAGEFRKREIPCDALYADIHHMDGYRVFTFGKTYPAPARMIAGLRRRGFKFIPIVDPGVKDEARFGTLARGRKLKAFVRDPEGRRDALGEVWPGRSRFPDFLNARTRQWWGDEQKALLDLGVAGIWNDMNEPANFARPDKTLDPECVHRTDHGPRRHREVHNAYGSQMARASRDGMLRHRPGQRPFVVTRAGYAGIQRHAAVWTGDNSGHWEHLADALHQCLGLGLSGVAFTGSDVGGFLDHPTPELFARWLQLAIFTPFLRNHSNLGTPPQEPWAFGDEVEAIARTTLNLRYQLLPYFYGLMAEAAATGTPWMRPLLWHHPNDATAVACNDQFTVGRNLLVAPILQPGAVARSVYLPRGIWFDFWTGERHLGGNHVVIHAPLHQIPVLVRAGTILPMAMARPFIGPREPDTVFLHVWPEDSGHLDWYDDDGITQRHETGTWQRRVVTSRFSPMAGHLRIGERQGPYVGHTKTWRVVLRGRTRGGKIHVGGEVVPSQWAPELQIQAFSLPVSDHALEARWR